MIPVHLKENVDWGDTDILKISGPSDYFLLYSDFYCTFYFLLGSSRWSAKYNNNDSK